MIKKTNAVFLSVAALAVTLLWTVAGAYAKPPDDVIDCSKLYNTVYDYEGISRAKQASLSDDDVARVLKMTRRSGLPFRYFVAALARKEPLSALARRAGVSMAELKDVRAEKDELAAYESAYFATGNIAARRNNIDRLLAQAATMKPGKP